MVLIDFKPFWEWTFSSCILLKRPWKTLKRRLESVSVRFRAKIKCILRCEKWPKIDPKAWTIVHGLIDFGPFWECPFSYCILLRRPWKTLRRRLERLSFIFRAKIKCILTCENWPKIDPNAWTIVHGFDRFWAILNVPIFFLFFAEKTLEYTLKEIGSSFSDINTLNNMFFGSVQIDQKSTQNHGL